MDSLKMVVDLASSGVIPFITVVLFLFVCAFLIYFVYRGCRDLEVYLLERKRLEDEIILKEKKSETWDT